VEVKLRVPDPPPYLRQDMTVSVDIEVARRFDVLVTRADAVFDAVGAHPWVLAVVGGRATKKPVTLGLKGEGKVEIRQGAAPGDLLVPSSAGVSPGQRVRVVGVASETP
jgi:HlyD family secretion protein